MARKKQGETSARGLGPTRDLCPTSAEALTQLTVADLKKLARGSGVALPARACKSVIVQKLAAALTAPAEERPRAEGPRHPLVDGSGLRKEGAVCGIDVHQYQLQVCVVGPGGTGRDQVLAEFGASNDPEGRANLIAVCRAHGVVHAAMEATSEYHLPVYWDLSGAGIQALVACPLQVAATQGVKTDVHDARKIALAHRDGRLKPSVTYTREEFEFRKVLRDGARHGQAAARCKQRLVQLLTGLGEKGLARLLNSEGGLKLLVAAALGATADELAAAAGKRIRGVELLLAALVRLQKSLGTGVRRFLIHLEEMRAEDRLEALCYAEIPERCRRDPLFCGRMRLLLSVPGISEIAAARILAEIVDPVFFPAADQLAKWTGLVPRVNQSGHRKKGTGGLYRGGDEHLRLTMFQLAQNRFALAQKSEDCIGLWMRRRYEEGKHYRVVVVAGAHKMLRLVWHLLAAHEEFVPPPTPAGLKMTANARQKQQAFARNVTRVRSAVDLVMKTAAALPSPTLADITKSIQNILGESRPKVQYPMCSPRTLDCVDDLGLLEDTYDIGGSNQEETEG